MPHAWLSYAVLLLGGACAAAFLVAPVDSGWQIGAWLVPYVAAAILLGVRARGAQPSVRGPLTVLLGGYLLYAGASAAWYLRPVAFGQQLPFPSPVDAVLFVSYAVFAIFLITVLRRRARGRAVDGRVALLDSLILTTSVSAVLWVAVLSPQLRSGVGALPTAVTVLYPVFALLLFALACRLATSGGFVRSTPGALLLGWVAAEFGGDVFYGLQSANGTFTHGAPLTAAWMVSTTCLGALAAHPRLGSLLSPAGPPATGGRRDDGRVARHVRPAVLLVAALVPLALAGLQQDQLVPMLLCTAVTFALISQRTSVVAGDLGDQRRVGEELERALAEVSSHRDRLARLAAVVDSTDDSVVTIAPDGTITGWNPGAERLYGYTSAEALGAHVRMISAPERMATFGSTMAALAEGRTVRLETEDVRKDGTRVPTSITVSNVYDETGSVTGFVAVARDMTERIRVEEAARQSARQLEQQAEELARLAFHDPLTGLGNRALFRQELVHMIDHAAARDGHCALVVLDLDDFKLVNDSLGHPVGDALLVAAAERLHEAVGEHGTVTRLGGDEFAILLDSADEAAAVAVAERVLTAFYRDFFVHGHALRTTASLGITVAATRASAADLLRSADLAMYAAKAAGKGKLAVYRQEMLVDAQQRLDLENHLRHALHREEMHLAYQPIVDGSTGELRAVEALLRWQHPTWGAVSPGMFIPVAEMSGTIVALGEWVLRRACRDAAALGQQRGAPVGMSVNVSVRQLQAPDFVETVRSALAESGLAPHLLTLELTETLLMEEDRRSTPVLRGLHAVGVHLSIDDFGTGHSSLARLRTLPVSELKIDRAFVNEITAEGDCGPIVTAVVAMARALGLFVVAEGVETQVQLDALRRLGCDAVQGYLIARPAPLVELRLDPAPVLAVPVGDREQGLVGVVERLRSHAASADGMSEPAAALVRAALGELLTASGLESVYLTRVDLDAQVQHVVLSRSAGEDVVPEGLVVDWADTVCKRAVDVGPTYTTNVPACFPDSRAASELGLMTYIGVAIRRTGGELIGTLCGASRVAQELTPDVRTLIEIIAHLMAQQLVPVPRAAADRS